MPLTAMQWGAFFKIGERIGNFMGEYGIFLAFLRIL